MNGPALVTPNPDLIHQLLCVELLTRPQSVLPATHRTTWGWACATGEDEFLPDVLVWIRAEQTGTEGFTGFPTRVFRPDRVLRDGDPPVAVDFGPAALTLDEASPPS